MGKVNKIAVIGAGAWGTALAGSLASNSHNVFLWGRDEAMCHEIQNNRSNPKYLPGIKLSQGITASSNLGDACRGADIILVVTPAQTTRDISGQMKPFVMPGTPIILCSKGIDRHNLALPSQVAKEILTDCVIGALSGPSFAVDVAQSLPTAVTLGFDDIETALKLSQLLSGNALRIYASNDRRGVELGGALKNVIAIAVGVTRGLGLGSSAEAALITRGFAEINRLASALGAQTETLTGLSGLGDLLLTCSSSKSRNFSYGIAIGKGEDLSNMPLAEGSKTVFMADALAQKYGLDCPLIRMVKLLVEGKISGSEAYKALLSRPLKVESNTANLEPLKRLVTR